MAGKWNTDERAEAIQELKARLLENAGRVVAIGEIGIDLSLEECNSAFEGRQVSFLQEFVSAILEHEALRSHPLVLHIRDRSSKLQTAHTVCAQALVDAGVPRDHKLYWHCLTGTSKDAEKWLKTFTKHPLWSVSQGHYLQTRGHRVLWVSAFGATASGDRFPQAPARPYRPTWYSSLFSIPCRRSIQVAGEPAQHGKRCCAIAHY